MLDYSYLFDLARNLYGGLSYGNKEGKSIIPLRYTLELTYRCNLNCPYCYVGDERIKDELSTQEWTDIINQLPIFSLVSMIGARF